MESRVLRLQDVQLAEASQVLARAFFDDPMMTYLMPDDDHRKNILPSFMLAGSRICLPYGELYTTPGSVMGSANWLPPGKTELSEEALGAAGAFEVLAQMGDEGAAKFSALMARLGEIHAKAVEPDHWYLLILGVDPPHQGQGVGGSLIEPILRRADAEGRSCYLETMKPRNVTFYQKHGFNVAVEDDTADGGLHFWTMRRDPR
jgi:GNAT superfamily N-acetyltransferase